MRIFSFETSPLDHATSGIVFYAIIEFHKQLLFFRIYVLYQAHIPVEYPFVVVVLDLHYLVANAKLSATVAKGTRPLIQLALQALIYVQRSSLAAIHRRKDLNISASVVIPMRGKPTST